jgi:hypothetical protein
MVKKNKINLDIINSISSSSPMKSNSPSVIVDETDSSNESVAVSKEEKAKVQSIKNIKTKKKLITIPEHWEDSIKEYLNGSGTVSSYLIQAIREKLREDKLI